MKKQIFSVIALLVVSFFALREAQATPTCTVTDARDQLTNSTFRYKVEEINYGNSNGGCTAAGTQDGLVVSNWINFQTTESNPTNGNAIDYIKLNPAWGPVEFLPTDSLLVGNYSHEALIDSTSELEYTINAFGDLGYFYEDETTIKDWGRIMIDARDYNDGQVPFSCIDGAADVYLRNMVLYTKGVDAADLLSNSEGTSCFKNGGGLYVCNGDPILQDGAEADSNNYVDPTTTTLDSQWCDTGCSVDIETAYLDVDGDGYGRSSLVKKKGKGKTTKPLTVEYCPDNGVPTGYSDISGDCNDSQSTINPAAAEICDGIDNNCDGQIDEGMGEVTYYADADGDGYGDAGTTQTLTSCEQAPAGYVTNSNDCDDTNAAINPAAAEACDGLDNNCNGNIDEGAGTTWFTDADGDTYGDAGAATVVACTQPDGFAVNDDDCNDADASINPGSTDICEDGIDQNCDGSDDTCVVTDIDQDGDGYPESQDCNDLDATINPGASELCGDDIDQNCDGADEECPVVIEVCDDGIDNDNDGLIDCEDPTCESSVICNGVGPEEECSDNIDNDGDGFTDCQDYDCLFEDACANTIETQCGDDEDNDADGLVDCFDPDCGGYIVDPETGTTCVDLQITPVGDGGFLAGGGGCGCDLSTNRNMTGKDALPMLLGMILMGLAMAIRTRAQRKEV